MQNRSRYRASFNTLRDIASWNLLEACRRTGLPTRVVVASSDKAHGTTGSSG
jgi:hypothetical protein